MFIVAQLVEDAGSATVAGTNVTGLLVHLSCHDFSADIFLC
jgi:hypothetical protein